MHPLFLLLLLLLLGRQPMGNIGLRDAMRFLQVFILLFSVTLVSALDFLPPFFSTNNNGSSSCDDALCGQGTCKPSNHTFLRLIKGYSCECKPGWRKIFSNDNMKFLPCVIPNCTLNYSCFSEAPSAAPTPPQISSNRSFIDPCMLDLCGEGDCVKTSDFSYRCDCREGSSNLLNNTNFPCFRTCALGANCTHLGLRFPAASSPPPPPEPSGISPPLINRAVVAATSGYYFMWTMFMHMFLLLLMDLLRS